MLDEMRAERLKKLDLLKAAGMDAYPATSSRTMSAEAFLTDFERLLADGASQTLAGRVMSVRVQGSIVFTDFFDGTSKLQLVMDKESLPTENFELFQKAVDQGDFVEATGVAYKTKRGQQSLRVAGWKMLAKSLAPLPKEFYGLQDPELKLRQRYLDILLDPEIRAMFERRSKFWQTIRQFYIERGFLEVETPVFQSTPGGADARPFETHHHALDIDVSLRISLELWLKRLLVAGFPKVFEIGRVFRNEGQSREHAQDYTMWESYEAYADYRQGMRFVQELYRRIAREVYGRSTFSINGHEINIEDEWEEIQFCELIKKRFGIDPLTASEEEAIQAVHDNKIAVGESLNKARAMDHLWKSIRKTIAGPAFLTGIPTYMEPLAKRSSENKNIVERFQILLAGSEVGKGFSELNDPQDQRVRFEEQQKLREGGDEEAQRLDEDYVQAMEYGMPPNFGFGMSERLFSFFEDKPINETQLFPLLRPKNK